MMKMHSNFLSWLKSNRLKVFLVLTGIILVFLSWHLDNPTTNGWAVKIFAPKYYQAYHAYETLQTKREITISEKGFSEVAGLILRSQRDNVNSDIKVEDVAAIKNNWVAFIPSTTGEEYAINCEVKLRDGLSVELFVNDVRELIYEEYLEAPLRAWSKRTMWLAIICSLFLALIDSKKKVS